MPESLHNMKERQFMVSLSNDDLYQSYSDGENWERKKCEPEYLKSSTTIENFEYLLLVLVHSSATSWDLRNSIRSTWLRDNHRQKKFLARFVVGLAGLTPQERNRLACENKRYRDLVLLPEINDSQSSGGSVSGKLLLSFSWSVSNVDYRFIFKCTDTTFAILGVILEELAAKAMGMDFLWGFFVGGMEATHKGYYGEPNWFLCSHFLPHPQSGGYVISKSLVFLIDEVGPNLQLYDHDDIALGVWLSPFKGMEFVHDIRFNTGHYSRGCRKAYIVTQGETVRSMKKKHAAVKGKRDFCQKEVVFRPSYHFNWTVPADRCCLRKAGIP